MGLVDDPISGVLGVLLKRAQDSQWWKWLQLFFSIGCSVLVVFPGVWGIGLISGMPSSIALGYALLATSVSVLTILTHDPRGRVLMLAIPKNVVQAYQKSSAEGDETIIEPGKK